MKPNDRWQLPEGIEELLPEQAAHIEQLRRRVLDGFASWGYELVIPPLMEFTESLLIDLGDDIELQTFKVVDQLTGRTLAIRADITPQTARIDASSLSSDGARRLCYAGSVLHARPKGLKASRAPIQVGAELYGEAGVSADIEVICLMLETLQSAGLGELTLDLGHVAIFRSLASAAGLEDEQATELYALLQRKAKADIDDYLSASVNDATLRSQIAVLADLTGGVEVLERARKELAPAIAVDAAIDAALTKLGHVAAQVTERYPEVNLYFDLSELRSFNYHTGLVFAAYQSGIGTAVANGGRYDEIGAVFGRARPATGFTTDLKALSRLGDSAVTATQSLYAPDSNDPKLWVLIKELRAQGQRVTVVFEAQELVEIVSRQKECVIVQDNSGNWSVG